MSKGRRIRMAMGVALLIGFAQTTNAQPQGEAGITQGGQSSPAVRLADLLAEAERNHPAIQAATRMAEAKRTRISQARAFPDPQITVGYMGDPAPFKTQANDMSSYRQFGVMQEIPYPGKRALKGQIASKEADAENWNIEMERRRVRAGVKMAYYDLAEVQHVLELTQKNKELLEKLAMIAEERYKVGDGLQQDVLRARVEVTRMLQRLTFLRQRQDTIAAQINSLLARPLDTPLGRVESLEPTVFAYRLEELVQKGIENSPEIRRQSDLIEQSQLAMNLAEKEKYPDFSVGWDYLNRTSGMPEMYGLRFTMNLPIFNKGWRRDAIQEAVAMKAGTQHAREAIRNTLMFQVKEQYLAARASEELQNLYAKAIVPQSSLALESSMTAYQTGKLDFLSVLTNFATILDYETNYYEEMANHKRALVRLEEITGIELDAPQTLSSSGQNSPVGK